MLKTSWIRKWLLRNKEQPEESNTPIRTCTSLNMLRGLCYIQHLLGWRAIQCKGIFSPDPCWAQPPQWGYLDLQQWIQWGKYKTTHAKLIGIGRGVRSQCRLPWPVPFPLRNQSKSHPLLHPPHDPLPPLEWGCSGQPELTPSGWCRNEIWWEQADGNPCASAACSWLTTNMFYGIFVTFRSQCLC